MPYTNSVPQANQTIASTTTPIRNNFAFIQTDAQVEHSFNNNIPGQAEGTHIKASMANIVDPAALPAGTNGIYYVNAGDPKYYNGTAYYLQKSDVLILQQVLKGTQALTTANVDLVTVPANSCGSIWLIPPAGISSDNSSLMGSFVSSATIVHARDLSSPGLTITSDTDLKIRAKTDSASFNGTYTYLLVLYTP